MTSSEFQIDDPLFDTEAGARYLAVSIPTMERWRRVGQGPSWAKLGGIVRYRKSALDAFVNECTRRPHRSRHTSRNLGSSGEAA